MAIHFDIIIATDLRFKGGNSSSVAQEVRVQSEAGYSTGLLHIPSPANQSARPFNQKIIDCLKLPNVELVDNDADIDTDLLIVRHPTIFYNINLFKGSIKSKARLIIANQAPYDNNATYYEVNEVNKIATGKFGSFTWHPIGPLVREKLQDSTQGVEIADVDWVNIIDVDEWQVKRTRPMSSKPIIGRHGRDQFMKWPDDANDILDAYPDSGDIKVLVLGGAGVPIKTLGHKPSNWTIYSYDDLSANDFLSKIDFFVYFHHPGLSESFGRTILEALASGAVAIVPSHFKPLFKDACIYAELDEVQSIISSMYDDWSLYQKQSKKGAAFVHKHFAQKVHIDRLELAMNKPKPRKLTAPRASKSMGSSRAVLFMSSNGAGVGHLTRLLAMASRSSSKIQPVFFTLSQGLKVVEDEGFPAEYMVSNSYLSDSYNPYWNNILENRIESLINLYNPAAIVFDGTAPYKGLLKVIKNHSEIKSVWSRRALWKQADGRNIRELVEISSTFDLVIEPGDLSQSADTGATVAQRENAVLLNPITFLDKSDLLSKATAREKLGIDGEKITALVQLGAGNINDTTSTMNAVLSQLSDVKDLQICVTKSVIGTEKLNDQAANIIRISHYPLSECFNAFDFAVGAAGYNSFHEFINFGLPSLLIPNASTSLDDQVLRAQYIANQGAALCALEGDVDDIKQKTKLLLDLDVRSRLRDASHKIYRPNGASKAIETIENLIEGRPL